MEGEVEKGGLMIGLRKRSYLVESGKMLKRFPPKTIIADYQGLRFSSWGGKLALVTTDMFGNHSGGAVGPVTLAYRIQAFMDKRKIDYKLDLDKEK